MDILKKIRIHVENTPEKPAICCGEQSLTYREVWKYSERLAVWLLSEEKDEVFPIAVYGHKSPWMLVCFLACVKSGRAYCPIDLSIPNQRVEKILECLDSGVVLSTEKMTADSGSKKVISQEKLLKICGKTETKKEAIIEAPENSSISENPMGQEQLATQENLETQEQLAARGNLTIQENIVNQENTETEEYAVCENKSFELDLISQKHWVKGDKTWYIIFTSGSTGVPKGVQISADCLNHYLEWSVTLGTPPSQKQGQVFLNQAPFSFDLSVMDLYTCLAVGGTLYCLEKSVQGDFRLLMESLRASRANVWVSTPSFAEMCLSDPAFQETLLPELELFLFCGETLGNSTVKKLQKRFPRGKIVNTYGPTESTVAVTQVLVTEDLAENSSPLPVGIAKPGTVLEIRDEQGRILQDEEKGEITILGNTVSTGYYRQEALSGKVFFETEHPILGKTRGYRTGDKGYLRDGMLYYCGRMDLQIKLHGYRIELEDIENNLRQLEGVSHAVVLPNIRNDRVKSLTAYVVEKHFPEDVKEEMNRLKRECLLYLPEYMVPKKFVFLEQMPMTNNGKADRKRLKEVYG